MAFLKIMSGPLAGSKFDIEKDEVTIGRASGNDIVLNEAAVSSKHCCIVRDGKKYTFKDLGSTNGTRLNEKKVTEDRLKPKDLITVGAVEIMFDGDDVEFEIPPTTSHGRPLVTIQPGSFATPPAIGGSSPFDRKRDNKAVWVVISVLIGALAVGALGWFIVRLLAL
jgi:pSer/pThr/pTyr-binding forkhead associated (FHA) protein